MKVAFLILAHHQPEMLNRLIGALQSEWSYFFIHIDAKSDLSKFERSLSHQPHVIILDRKSRLKINWGGYSVLSATLNLLKSASDTNIDFWRFCLLSGNDYPIKSHNVLFEHFCSKFEYIQIQRMLEPDGTSPFDRRARRFYFGDNSIFNPRSGSPLLRRFAIRLEHLFDRPYPDGVDIYYGSQWWCLTAPAVRAVLKIVADRPDLVRWFRRITCADELFFQTFIKMTAHSENIAYEYRGLSYSGQSFESMHYIDWFTPNPTVPKVLDLTDLPAILQSRALFARKFDERSSSDLLDKLDGNMSIYPTVAES